MRLSHSKKRQHLISRYLPAGAAAATGILVGSAMVATRFVIHQTPPASLALLRYSIGFCCLLPPVLLSPPMRFERRDWLPIGLLGITQFGILIALLNYALQFIPSARAALIFASMPWLTMMLAAVLGHERLTFAKALGVLLTFFVVMAPCLWEANPSRRFRKINAFSSSW